MFQSTLRILFWKKNHKIFGHTTLDIFVFCFQFFFSIAKLSEFWAVSHNFVLSSFRIRHQNRKLVQSYIPNSKKEKRKRMLAGRYQYQVLVQILESAMFEKKQMFISHCMSLMVIPILIPWVWDTRRSCPFYTIFKSRVGKKYWNMGAKLVKKRADSTFAEHSFIAIRLMYL